ncbi:MAG: aminotransferase [Planctomycetaceae bacterium]|nr:aminotransferase [Planctomycetaceae bacterium]
MPEGSYKRLFTHFLAAGGDRLHFAAHSHHLWPDVAREAQLQAFDEAARHVDGKWEPIFGELWPRAAGHVARLLSLPDPGTVCFGPNVHDFLLRILSGLPGGRIWNVLTTDGEFHSLRRQMARLVEAGRVRQTIVPTEPFDTLAERFSSELAQDDFDLVYASHVFFDSGYVFEELPGILNEAPLGTVCVVDGYHGFLARPTDFSAAAGRVFYTSGGYKYAMSGEGVCFLHAPPGIVERPLDTGWFAGFAALEAAMPGQVPYPTDGQRFLGATFDPTGLYRFVAVQDMLEREGLTPLVLHNHARALSDRFLGGLERKRPLGLSAEQLVPARHVERRGNFLTFRRPDAGELKAKLWDAGVITDCRADRLRFGFGIYHDAADVDRLVARLEELAR